MATRRPNRCFFSSVQEVDHEEGSEEGRKKEGRRKRKKYGQMDCSTSVESDGRDEKNKIV